MKQLREHKYRTYLAMPIGDLFETPDYIDPHWDLQSFLNKVHWMTCYKVRTITTYNHNGHLYANIVLERAKGLADKY